MTDPNYNSVENYARLFGDIICEVSDEGTKEETIVNMLAGFEQAIIDMMIYHEGALDRLKTLHGRYMRGEFSKAKEQYLPPIDGE